MINRIPEMYRERVRGEFAAAEKKENDAERLAHYDELMGRYNRIAEAAGSAAANAGHAGTIVHAQVWADELAKLDGNAS